MKLEDQVCSLELSKRLKELGVKQESYFKYCGGHTMYYDSDEGEYEECPNPDLLDPLDEYCHTAELTTEFTVAAFTVAELGKMLPINLFVAGNHYCGDVVCNNFWLDFERDSKLSTKKMKGWIYFYSNGEETIKFDFEQKNWDNTEANARAKMLIYLLEQKLITL